MAIHLPEKAKSLKIDNENFWGGNTSKTIHDVMRMFKVHGFNDYGFDEVNSKNYKRSKYNNLTAWDLSEKNHDEGWIEYSEGFPYYSNVFNAFKRLEMEGYIKMIEEKSRRDEYCLTVEGLKVIISDPENKTLQDFDKRFFKLLLWVFLNEKKEVAIKSISDLVDAYIKDYIGISTEFFNRFGTVDSLNLVWGLITKQQEFCFKVIPMLTSIALHEKTGYEKLAALFNKDEETWLLLYENGLLYQLESEKVTFEKISIFGILLLIVHYAILKEFNIVDKIVGKNQDVLPLVFKKWSTLKSLKSWKKNGDNLLVKTIHDLVTINESKVFHYSMDFKQFRKLMSLYYNENDWKQRINELYESGKIVFNEKLSNEGYSEQEIKQFNKEILESDYVSKESLFQPILQKYPIIIKKLRELKKTIGDSLHYWQYLGFQDKEQEKKILEPLQEAISYHFYTYLQSELIDFENHFLNKTENKKVKDFWIKWNNALPDIGNAIFS